MRVSDSNRYEPVSSTNVRSSSSKKRALSGFLEAFRVVLSQKALDSDEYNDPKLFYPTFNEDALLYTHTFKIIKK